MSAVKTDYTREELIAICEQAVVPEEKWRNRDSPSAQRQIGEAWGRLKAGCSFYVHVEEDTNSWRMGRVIRLSITSLSFDHFECGSDAKDSESYYLPSPLRLKESEGKDWYL